MGGWWMGGVRIGCACGRGDRGGSTDGDMPRVLPTAGPSPPPPQVYSVDCNPAQSALLELKRVAIRRLGFEDVWALFGEGKVCLWVGGGWGGELVGGGVVP